MKKFKVQCVLNGEVVETFIEAQQWMIYESGVAFYTKNEMIAFVGHMFLGTVIVVSDE